ncbi:DUF305 domain-containing protein [Aureimonas sp. Leaf324]|uniref:DUF305 domain-containing protein n=1 Tax=Aureimonas sp. Leaf324 TaxID=1736336 RepID=UPI0009EA60B1|nr:DUF305 domain-containing protein [Aureimonas sp. Leaf324]
MSRAPLLLALALFAAAPLVATRAQDPSEPAGSHGAMDHDAMGHGAPSQPGSPTASQRMMRAMDTMHQAMAQEPMTGRPGLDFARMMIPHHQSAIDMARAYLDSGENDPTLTRISRDVISSQEKEIAELRAWIEANKGR